MEKTHKLTKETLLESTSGGWLYIIKIFPDLIKINESKCKPVINHLRGEKNASLSFIKRNEKWLFHDFGCPEYKGDFINLYAIVNNIDDVKGNFVQILEGIYREVFDEEPPKYKVSYNTERAVEDAKLPEGVPFQITEKSMDEINKAEQEFLDTFQIGKETLEKLNIVFLKYYTFYSENKGKVFKINSIGNDFIFAHKWKDTVKLYRPNNIDFKHIWLGEYPYEYFMGSEIFYSLVNNVINGIVPKESKIKILLCAGSKDTMVATQLGFTAICLNSETSDYIPSDVTESIRKMNKTLISPVEILIIYDRDVTGIKQSEIIKDSYENFGFKIGIISLPDKLVEAGGKDVADWIDLGFPKDELIQLIERDDWVIEQPLNNEKSLSSISPVSPQLINQSVVSDLDKKKSRIVNLKNHKMRKNNELDLSINNEKKLIDQEKVEGEMKEMGDLNKISSDKIKTEISKNVYNAFPNLLKEMLSPFEDDYKTMMAMSFLTVLGSAFHNVTANFRRDKVYPNLYTIIIAPAASGKSLIKWARSLIMPIEKYLDHQSKVKLLEYNHKLDLMNKGELKRDEIGEEPKYKLQLIPTDITSSMWIKQISDNDGYGLMFDTEIDGLIESNSGNLRSFNDYLRKAYEGEPLTLMRKTNRERVFVEEGKMSLLLSGTPQQFFKLIPEAENGMFSRIIPLKFNGFDQWKNAFSEEQFDFENHFDKLSGIIFDIFKKLSNRKTSIKFSLTSEQMKEFDNEFKKRLESVKSIVGFEGKATVFRLGAITVKIAMILSVLRCEELDAIEDKIQCNNEDFQSAMSITGVILEHVLETLKLMNNERIENYYRGKKLDYFYALPQDFTYALSQKIAKEENVKLRTAQKWVYEFRNKGFLINPVKGEFKKVG